MKRLAVVTLIGALAVIVGQIPAVAQMGMMGGMHHMDSTTITTRPGMTDQSAMMQMRQIVAEDSTMTVEFSRLEKHFAEMMKINDLNTLKDEMAKHQEIMAKMHNEMMHHRQMAREMQGMMPGMLGMHSGPMMPDSAATAHRMGDGY